MKIDNNEMARKQQQLSAQGFTKEAFEMKMEFLKQVKESGVDHCSCKEPCPHHGNCYECVVLHRGHRDHLPFCFWDMINEKLYGLSRMTEGSLTDFVPAEEGNQQE